MAVQMFHVEALNIKKEIDEEEEKPLPTDPVFNSNLEPFKTVKQEGYKWSRDNLKCEDESEDESGDETGDESEDEKPDIKLLNTFINSKCKLEDESDSDEKSLFIPKLIKTEPLSPVEEKTITDIKIDTNNDSSDEEFIPITEEVKKEVKMEVNFSSFDVEESCYDIKKDCDFISQHGCVDEMPVERSNVNNLPEKPRDTSQRKRIFSTDHSDEIASDPVEESNNNYPVVKRKRVHFAEEGSITSTRIFERSKKPISFVPSNKKPGVGILKNKLTCGEIDLLNSSVGSITQLNNARTLRNRKEGKRTKSLSEADVINKKLTRQSSKKTKEPSPKKGKKKKSLNKNTQTSANTRITEFFNKKSKDPNKTQLDSREKTDTNKTNESSEVEGLETVTVENKKKIESNAKTNNESQKEYLKVDYTTRNIYKHNQKRKSKKQYAFKRPVLAYLCLCGAWCKSGPELNAHLSVCVKLQPRVVLTRLKL